MLWSQEEQDTLRSSSILHLKRHGLISDSEVMKEDLFTCDTCDEVEDCEWSFHHENIREHCTKKEVNKEEQDESTLLEHGEDTE